MRSAQRMGAVRCEVFSWIMTNLLHHAALEGRGLTRSPVILAGPPGKSDAFQVCPPGTSPRSRARAIALERELTSSFS